MDLALYHSIAKALGTRGIAAAWVYGSVAHGNARAESDIDVALLGRAPLTAEELVDTAAWLSRIAQREVDIVDLYGVHGTLLEEVLTRGQMLFCDDRDAYERLMRRMVYDEADFMPLYRRLLRERRDRFLNE